MSPVIELVEVSKSFRGVPVLRDVSMRIEQGRTYALVGPNGSGKSVLLKLLCRFARPDTGVVSVAPEFLSADRTFPDRFGVIINGPAFVGDRGAEWNLLELARIQRRVGIEEVRATLARVGLSAPAKQKMRHYSLGMKQKFALAQALLENPAVLILDEPFNALDEASAQRVKEIIREEQSEGKTIVFTSHNQQDVADLADEVYRISDGAVRREPEVAGR